LRRGLGGGGLNELPPRLLGTPPREGGEEFSFIDFNYKKEYYIHKPFGVVFNKEYLNIMDKIINYIKEVIAETKNVTWPTHSQTIIFTVAVLIISIGVAYYLGLLDFLFSEGLNFLLNKY
jgi:preprotein translocase subunit SecE